MSNNNYTGYAIVVADRGFVYVGQVEMNDAFCVIRSASNVRKWGTTKGLGQLAINGPTPETILDRCGIVRVPSRAVISILESEEGRWS